MESNEFRIATANDFDELTLLVNEFDKFLSNEHGESTITIKELARSRRYVKKYLADKDCAYIMMLKKDRIVGYAFLSKDKKNKTLGFINELFIDKNERKKGYAKKLIKYCNKWFRDNNIKQIQLTVNRSNKKAIKLYKEFRFEIHDNGYVDMRLKL